VGLFRRKPAVPPRGRPAYRNESVIRRIAEEEGVDRDTAAAWFDEMLIFLDLCAESTHVLAPSKPVDVAWHAFVLHTRDYEAYCRERFGRLVHHEPAERADRKAYARAYKRRRELYGTPAADVWPITFVAADAGGDSGGGGGFGGLFDGGGDRGSSGDSGGGSSCGGGGCGGGGG
jgi:hypothetical protein